MKDTARQSDGATVASNFMSGDVAHVIEPLGAGSSSAPFRGFAGDQSRLTEYGNVVTPTDEVMAAPRTRDLPDMPGYPVSFRTYGDGN